MYYKYILVYMMHYKDSTL